MSVGGAGRVPGDRFEGFEGPEDAAKAGEAAAGESERALPRSGWQDRDALSRAVRSAQRDLEEVRSRPNHRTKWADARRGVTGADRAAGPVSLQVMAYGRGGARPGKADDPSSPVIAMKYGGPTRPPVDDGGAIATQTDPVIVMKYGGPTRPPVDGGGAIGTQTDPVIVMKYGGPTRPPADEGGGGGPTEPVIAMKYGAPTRPRD